MTVVSALLGTFGWVAVGVAFFFVARLSHRLGTVTHARPYYRLLDIAGGFVCAGALGNLLIEVQLLAQNAQLTDNTLSLLCEAAIALGVSLGLGVAWYYWSWLLAERD